jgi:hypothetical protein
MFGDGSLTFREFAMREPLPLATIHDAVLEFLRGHDDPVLFAAQAVNAYVDEPRMTQDVDILSSRAAELAEELRAFLSTKFHIAVRLHEIGEDRSYRIFQIQKPKNRHLVDVRQVSPLPPAEARPESPRGVAGGTHRQQGDRLPSAQRQTQIGDRLARHRGAAASIPRSQV